jgi:ATP-dependent DNA ligase
MFVKPMKAQPVDEIPSGPYIMEPKFDGWRCLAVSEAGRIILYTNTGKTIDSVPYINEALKKLPVGTIVDGEIVDLAGDTQWNRTQTICSRYATHIPTASDPALSYVLFDILALGMVDYKNEPLSFRKTRLADLFRILHLGGVVGQAPHWGVSQGVLDHLVTDKGFEGVVCKHSDSKYVPGSRNRGWVKIKPYKEIDVLCTGTFPAKEGSKYDGNAVGGITFEVVHEDGTVYDGQCAGMDDFLRTDLYDHPEKYIGRVVEIKHWGIGKDGALRHPNLYRFRDVADKDPTELNPYARVMGIAAAKPIVMTDEELQAELDSVEQDKPWEAMMDLMPHTGIRTPPKKRVAPKLEAGPSGRMRNYKAMGDAKLMTALIELRRGSGDAYDRALEGSGDPAADLAVAELAAANRKLFAS